MACRILQNVRLCNQTKTLSLPRPSSGSPCITGTATSFCWPCNNTNLQKVPLLKERNSVRSFSCILTTSRPLKISQKIKSPLQTSWLCGVQCQAASAAVFSKWKTTSAFKVLDGDVDTSSEKFETNKEHCRDLEQRLEQLVSFAKQGGGEKGIQTHVERNKKILVRDRLRMLLDDYDNGFLEVGTIVGMGMEYGDIPSAGLVTGIGRIQGIWCVVVANDASVKGGTGYPITVKKQLRAQEIGLLNHLPCVYIVDSGGAFLPLQAQIFPDKEHGGRTFYNEAVMSSMKIPQVAIVCGSCTAGGAYVPAMADEAVIVHRIGTIFLGGPPLVYAATGEKISSEDLGGATLHCKVSGVTDHFADTEEDAYETGRSIISSLNVSLPPDPEVWEEPLYSADELAGLAPRPGVESECVKKILARLVDGSRFQEFKTMYGPTLITGFAHIQGYLVGIVANNGSLMHDAALKGAHFVEICCQRNIPLIFFQNTTADESLVEKLDEKSGEVMGDALRARARMIATIACANVPKLTVIIGGSFGTNNYAMCGRSLDPKFVFTWPTAQIGIVTPEEATRLAVEARFPATVQATSEEKQKFESEVADKARLKASAFYASSRVWDDGIILPHQTRQVLGQCLSIVSQHKEQEVTKYGVIRM